MSWRMNSVNIEQMKLVLREMLAGTIAAAGANVIVSGSGR